ncbi:hypothetical protein BBP40_004258 [Aspergillus hancockii]|nr:hypothetical protein BBP40_004258 [Aspergillus hancockii]
MSSNATLQWADNASENAIGPASRSREYDFTLTFEQSILSILPSAILLFAGLVRLFYLFQRHSKTLSRRRKHLLKLIAASIHLALQLSLLVLWSVSLASRTSTSSPAAALGLANAVVIGLSYVRTLWLLHRVAIAAVQTVVIGIKIAMLILEARAKTSYLKTPYKEYPPEAISSILDLSFVWWLSRLFAIGYPKLIGSQDLFDLDLGLRSSVSGKKLKQAWEKYLSAPSKHSPL